ncbi:hypothetical protein D3C85_1502550 [compost metagenome]
MRSTSEPNQRMTAGFFSSVLANEVTARWSHFEWGTINGKLSAIRWMLGDEWDNLDT